MAERKPLLHILVIGFHHKKGCQVEFSYPPLISGTDGGNECPTGWKYLPTLALPDGSHNFEEDSVFFTLPSLDDQNDSVYGVSCYRQIPVEQLKIRTADLTRSTVQKSVCALISIPIYGYIDVKLSLIAHAFFDQGDFSSVDILIDAYDHLNACLTSQHIFSIKQMDIGLNLRELILKWRHKVLILFKLLLLQRRIICFGSPVKPICSLILGIASLHPLLLEKGFQQVACVRTSRPMSPMPDFSLPSGENVNANENIESDNKEAEETIDSKKFTKFPFHKQNSSNGAELGKRSEKSSLPRDASVDALVSASLAPLCALKPNTWYAPLPIFQNGNLCLPYLSLPYMDLLSDSSVHGYIIGTSNILFQQKKQLADVLINVDAAIMEAHDQELRRQLQLTTEDLRFIDFVLRHVTNPKEDAEGSEHWIKTQFQGYMVAMLKTSLGIEGNGKDFEHFNGSFMFAWKNTQCYQDWYNRCPDYDKVFYRIPNGHPFAGNLSVADMKLKLSQTMHNTESGRKINHAVNSTSKAVGGALSQAKGAFSTWWSSITTSPPPMSLVHSQSTDDDSQSSGSNATSIKCSNQTPPIFEEGIPNTPHDDDRNPNKIIINEGNDNLTINTSTINIKITDDESTNNTNNDDNDKFIMFNSIEMGEEAEIIDQILKV